VAVAASKFIFFRIIGIKAPEGLSLLRGG